jgi:hypothetical protein
MEPTPKDLLLALLALAAVVGLILVELNQGHGSVPAPTITRHYE